MLYMCFSFLKVRIWYIPDDDDDEEEEEESEEDNEDEEPDIYGTLNDKRGDKLDLAGFVGTSGKIILNLNDGRCLQIVFLDESGEFEVNGGFREK